MKLGLLVIFLGIIMISSTFSISSSYAFLPENLPEKSQASSHVRVIEGENLIAYARPLYTSPDDPTNNEVPISNPHDGVAKLRLVTTDGTFGCTGTLGSDKVHVFTAAHCITDNNGNYILTSGSATFEGNSESLEIAIDADPAKSKAHPNYDGDFIKGNDIAILKLSTIAPPQIPGIPHATSGSAVGDTVTKSGYGLSGYFNSGTDRSTYPFGTERTGQNEYDAFADTMYVALGLTSGVHYVPQAIYQFDSDDGTSPHDAFGFFFGIPDTGLGDNEVMSASGDSGGPTILNGELVGVTSYGITLQYTNKQTSDCTKQRGSPSLDSSCGEFAGDTRVASYSSFIDSVLNSEPNNSPTADDQLVFTDEDTALPITLTGADEDLDALTFTVATPPTNGVLSGIAPNLTYTPNTDFNGSELFTFKANDGTADSNIATISIMINPVDDAPTAVTGGPYIGTVNEAITFDGTGSSDPDGDALTYSWKFGDGSSGTGESPSHTYSEIDEFIVELTVSDGQVSNTSITTVTVNDISVEVSVNSIIPNSVAKGQFVNVTISGNAFVSGASVTLSNGSGPTPSVSNVVVIDDNTITATITAKSGGPPRDSLWDVTVTNVDLSSDTLVNQFTVTRN